VKSKVHGKINYSVAVEGVNIVNLTTNNATSSVRWGFSFL
jgi:hypothetical protein